MLDNMKKIFIFFLILLIIFSFSAPIYESPTENKFTALTTRTTDLNVKLVFVGFKPEQINQDFLLNEINLPNEIPVSVISPKTSQARVSYRINYDLSFVDDQVKDKLITYLGIIEEKASSGRSRINIFYEADKVEGWLYQNKNDFGGFPDDSITFFIAYLPELPVERQNIRPHQLYNVYYDGIKFSPHYYNTSAEDADLGYKLTNREYMTAFGGNHRFWFLDLSAGPSSWSENDLPLQAILDHLGIDTTTSFGKKWLTEYVSDYIYEMVYNFACPHFVYEPIFSEKYRIVIELFDNRTSEERSSIALSSTIDENKINEALQDLLPYSEIKVEVEYLDIASYPDLRTTIRDSYKKADPEWRYTRYEKYGTVDLRQLYYYIDEQIDTFIPGIKKDESEYTIPVFLFAFEEQTYLSYPYKRYMLEIHPEIEAEMGIAFSDFVIIGLCQYDFQLGDKYAHMPTFQRSLGQEKQQGKGIGYTHTVIHELGHMLGLRHPITTFSSIGDFSHSVMSSFTYEYKFGQFEKDAIRRIHADSLMLETYSLINETLTILESKVESHEIQTLLENTEDLLLEGETQYSEMNYVDAVKIYLEARDTIKLTLDKAVDLPKITEPLDEEIQSLSLSLEEENENNKLLQKQLTDTQAILPLYIVVSMSAGAIIGYIVTLIKLTIKYKRSKVKAR